MSNLEELKEAESNLRKILEPLDRVENSSLLNMMASTYLPIIAKSLAVIADKMSEKDKEEHPPITNEEKFKEVFGFDFIEANDTDSPSWPDLWLESEYKEPIKED